MSYTNRFSEVVVPLLDVIPVLRTAAAAVVSADFADLGNYHRAVLVVHTGAMVSGTGLEIQLLQATSAIGAGAKGIPTDLAPEKILELDGDDDDSIFVIELRAEELDINNGFHFVGISYDVDDQNATFSAILFGIEPRYAPVPVTAYAEIVD